MRNQAPPEMSTARTKAPRTALPCALSLPIVLLAALLAALLLTGCGLERKERLAPISAPIPAPVPQAPAKTAAAVTLTDDDATTRLNVLVNDTSPASLEYDRLRAELLQADAGALSPELRWPLAQVLAFDPPRLAERWQARQKSLDDVAARYAANPPDDYTALTGARVVRRLGPALYVVTLKGGEGVLFATSRKLKKGARLKGILCLERPQPKPDASKGDLVDELKDQPRTFVEISRQEAKRRDAERAPVLAEIKRLEADRQALEQGIARDLRSLDMLTRDVNAVIGPRLLPRADAPAPATLIQKVRRMAKSFSRDQYYRYALPVTGRPQVDAALKASLEERRAEVQQLLRSTGVGRGRSRANSDRIAFQAFTASPRLLSIRFEELRDTGGAHPNTAYESFVFDLDSQKRLGLADVFSNVDAALGVLSQLATRRLELAIDGALFAEGLAPKPENFAVFVIDGADLLFTFPPYQAASYAQGAQSLRVPLFQPRLLPLLKPGLLDLLARQ